MPQTTILLPTYNCEKYIRSSIESILQQSYTNYELLIIDDGSTDNTVKALKEFEDARIRYIKNNKNIGIVRSLNKGIALAKGRYIARMDADDIILGNRLEEQISFLDDHKDYGMVGSLYQIIDKHGRFLTCYKPLQDDLSIKLGLLFRNQFVHAGVTMRTDIAKEFQYKQSFIYVEDYDLWCRISKKYKVANLPFYHLSYRWYSENSCNTNQRQLKTNMFKLLLRELKIHGITCNIHELALHGALCFGYGKNYFNTPEKINSLNNWLDKIYKSESIKAKYDETFLQEHRSFTKFNYAKIDI